MVTGPSNLYTGPAKSGKAEDVYFSSPGFICTGDLFKDAGQATMRTMKKDGYLVGGHDRNFKLTSNVNHKPHKAPFNYIEEGVKKRTKPTKDEDGKVPTGPSNFYTSPLKRGGNGIAGRDVFFNKLLHMGGPGETRTAVRKEKEENPMHDKAFSQRAKGLEFFNSHKGVYMEDPPVQPLPAKPKRVYPELHDKAFRDGGPVKKGKSATLGSFPKHMACPPNQKKYVKPADDAPEAPPGFKATKKFYSRPTPSIACNMRNLKSSFPSAFASRVR